MLALLCESVGEKQKFHWIRIEEQKNHRKQHDLYECK